MTCFYPLDRLAKPDSRSSTGVQRRVAGGRRLAGRRTVRWAGDASCPPCAGGAHRALTDRVRCRRWCGPRRQDSVVGQSGAGRATGNAVSIPASLALRGQCRLSGAVVAIRATSQVRDRRLAEFLVGLLGVWAAGYLRRWGGWVVGEGGEDFGDLPSAGQAPAMDGLQAGAHRQVSVGTSKADGTHV